MSKHLITGGDSDPLLPRLLEAIHQADEIELAVAFVKASGLEVLFPALSDAITSRDADLTVLTSDYLDITDPQALRQLMLLAERGADVRVFETNGRVSFHLKAYIFLRCGNGNPAAGTAFIGSSNISKVALTDGLEWNYCVEFYEGSSGQEHDGFREIRKEYEALLNRPEAVRLNHPWIRDYEKRRRPPSAPPESGSGDPPLPVPTPSPVQEQALQALSETVAAGYRRGLVVMATGLGKTYLAGFLAARINAETVLFVAHREEILLQAEATFQRIFPRHVVGRYAGERKEKEAGMLFASVQTLGQSRHLERFPSDHFDCVVVDEFHHAAAPTYRRLLAHFEPRFMLGLTATPDRTDQSDILSLCDDNLVFSADIYYGIERDLLCVFSYYGIHDETVDYREIPWRSGRFDPDSLSNKLATLSRARHALKEWRDKAGKRTLAFCVSIRHARFMAEQFENDGIRSVAVHGGSDMDRSEALERLAQGTLEVVFSVDLFNEGVDLPQIDTVMMLRPTESRILFLQQLGRGLRRHPEKERLVVLDFIGNHKGFINKPQALLGALGNRQSLAALARRISAGRLDLPDGCYVNYDLRFVDFLRRLSDSGASSEYQILRDSLGRRPTLTEYFHSGADLARMRRDFGYWWDLVRDQEDLTGAEETTASIHESFLREVEVTSMTKSFKAVLLESLLENDGFRNPPTLEALAEQALKVFSRRRRFIPDITEDLRDIDRVDTERWLRYWDRNPVNAWTGGNRKEPTRTWFEVSEGKFRPTFTIGNEYEVFQNLLQEVVDYRLAAYSQRLEGEQETVGSVVSFPEPGKAGETELPFFPNLKIACGYFRNGRADECAYVGVGDGYGHLDPARHFVARAVGDSMNGGKRPIHDGDYLLLELISPTHAGSISGSTMVIERQDVVGNDQYL
ncbi:MAG: DEAD/DEAH box helicase family protein, partial [Pseudomonadota bacterium]|nr:DEAD/DEAH box helicase family protein [Pseudomonadota bacterium]